MDEKENYASRDNNNISIPITKMINGKENIIHK